jgi:D-threo-aldose 1-dehydrogenase
MEPKMATRRHFLSLALKGSALTLAATFLPGAASASDLAEPAKDASNHHHYRPPLRFGMGGVPLGNEFSVVTDKDAYSILEAAWSAGVRYYDVSPWYGLGLAEQERLPPILQGRETIEGFKTRA